MPINKAISSPYARIVNTPRITFYLLIISTAASLAIDAVYVAIYGIDGTAISLMFLGLVCVFLLWIHHKGHYQIAGLCLYLLVSGVLTYNITIGNAIYDEAMLAYPLIVVFTGLIFGKRSVVLVTGSTIVQFILVYILALDGIVQPFDGLVTLNLEEIVTTIIILIATGVMLWMVVNIIENTVQRIVNTEIELEKAYDLTLEAWAKALELRGREVAGHSRRVTELSVKLAERLGFDGEALKYVRQGALLHDIGKMSIPEVILLKPGPLTKDEWEIVSKHTIVAEKIFKDIPYLGEALKIVSCHHERVDGQGYPYKLQSENIPIEARMFSVVDNWDMLRSDRPYSRAWTDEEARAYLETEAGKKFDPRIVEELFALIEADGVIDAD